MHYYHFHVLFQTLCLVCLPLPCVLFAYWLTWLPWKIQYPLVVLTRYLTSLTYTSYIRAPDKVRIFIPKMPISSPNPMFDHLLESSHQDNSKKWSNIGFDEEITQVESIEVNFTHLIWSSSIYLDENEKILYFPE